ncbi:trifunctional serine/threonine-protein kinase/ATP-binding protein/sensor histidine kinase [Calothrix sp. NIES-2098]|uniref:trifunctional serine/threonine-protein kinase/ATP-binding protein/sensor histidine kinase n=1 Tax=Calothrix sp. NIES-2098 TaxID=1954171 RepID=UPI000B61BFEF|nr:multi-sensor signal transduction multi-kinase [Calothrix sp. NIES-2098]
MATVNSNPIVPGYQINSQLYAGSRTKVYRAIRESHQLPVVLKLLTAEYPSFNELVQFRHQYTIAKNLNIPGIIHPLSLESYGNSYILVMPDTGEISLREYIKNQNITLVDFLSIAIQLIAIIQDLHEHRVIHKDIKPANILINSQTKQVQIIDFSIASLLPKETPEIQSPNVLEGTLAYISPEQTGRMNRGIDYRSDYYSLGVTLYEILTKELPFQSNDPMELVHCHLAKMPTAIGNSQEIPQVIADIVMKLMAKNAEDRYQSALGLKHDLELCLHQLKNTGEISDFEIAQRDVCDRFLIPEKLYGREAEVNTLLQAFERVANGTSEMMLVAGFSGIGKTAVVNEVHKPITRQHGYFIKGKFDQFNRNIPLSAFVQALRDLMGQLLSESDGQLAQWRNQILQVVRENAQVLIEVIPELERVIGKQPPAPELSGTAAQNRFNLLFQKFIAIFTTKEHPLVMFLDDLQWADLASLQLIKLLMEDKNYLLLLGAYRDNEVSPAHPFMLTVEELKKAGKTVNAITLAPLSLKDANQLVADTLHCTTEQTLPITELINRKTKGNPFFTTQFLKTLHEDGQITFNRQQGYWECDLAQVNALSVTNDVVEFMATQLQKLPHKTQNILKLAACIGNSFDLKTLAVVSQQSPQAVADALWEVLQEGLILPQSQVYKFYLSDGQQVNNNEIENVAYRFLHDRVQQAAYSLIPEDQKQVTHLAIGQLLHANIPETQLESNIFEIVNHLNISIDLITQPEKKLELAELNLMAGRKAKSAIAYNAAVKYCTQAIDLLPTDTWAEQYELTLNLHYERLEATYLNTDFDQLGVWGDIILESATSLLDTIKVHETRMMAFRSQGRFAEAVETGLQVLKLLGVEFPAQPTIADIDAAAQQTRQLWQGRTPSSLLDLPAMSDPHQLAAMQIFSNLVSSAHIAAPLFLPLLIFKQVEMSIQFGNSPITIFSYADYGLVLCGVMGDLDAGYEFGQLSLKLLEKLQVNAFKSRAYFIINTFIRHWKEPLHHTFPSLLEGYQNGLESGDWVFMALNLVIYSQHGYWSGRELTDLAQEMEVYRQVISQVKQEANLKYQECYQQTILNLLGQAKVPYCLEGKVFNATEVLPSLQATGNRTGLFYLHLNQAVLCYLFGEYKLASQQVALAEQYSDAVVAYFVVVIRVFYDALIHLARYTDADTQEQSAILERINAHQEKLQTWANHAPFNHLHRWQLVAAERYRVLGEFAAAMEHYDLAIAGAKTHGYLQEEALSNELAAKFYLTWSKQKVAAGYMQEAYYCYARWGAKAKTEELENRYPDLLYPILQQGVQTLNVLETLSSSVSPQISIHTSRNRSRSSGNSINVTLDFAAILKASQAISGTIQLDELLHKLTQIILQYSGGDRCALILPNSRGEWFLRAIAVAENTEIFSEALEGNANLPVKLIQYVKNTQEIVVIDELKTDLPVIDEYLRQRQPKSLLCLPILNQGQVIGILYLKNHVTSGVFTSDRILILSFLCTQAAISLQNAQLYQQSQIALQELQKSQQLLRNIIDTVPQVVFWKDRNSTYLGCNQKFAIMAGLPSPEAIVGKNDYDLPWSKAESDSYREYDRQIMESKQPQLHILETLQQTDGTTLWVDTSKIPLCDEAGEVYGILGSFEDISDRKRAEETILQKSQELEKALVELQNAQLQMVQSEKMSALGNLVAGIAHEMNNPLGFIAASLKQTKPTLADLTEHLKLYQQALPNPGDEILDHAEDIDLDYSLEDLPKMLDAMVMAADRLKNISTSLRTFSRADKDHKVPFNINEGIDSTILILKHRLKANEKRPEITVLTEYDKLQPIECFPGQLNQVFMNILANAIDALDESSIGRSFEDMKLNPHKIIVKTSVDECNLKISIADNGNGISEEVKARIFDHLFTTKGVGKGTGLGLAIARQIVEEIHGGKIAVNSVLGEGTEFIIHIPYS